MPGKPASSTIGMSTPGSHVVEVTALPVATGDVT
jgi:hypothetical protein